MSNEIARMSRDLIMPREYDVTKKPKLYVDPLCGSDERTKYISYRMVICHAIHTLIRKGMQKEQISSLINELCNKLESGDLINDIFLEVRHLKECADVLIIDKTNGTYPLVLRDGSVPEEPDRVSPFKISAEDVSKSFESVYEILYKADEFNQVVHDQLITKLHFSKNDNRQ